MMISLMAGGKKPSVQNPLPIAAVNIEKTDGTRTSAHVSDDRVACLLSDMLIELKRMNMHLGIITDEVIENQEII